MELEKKYYQDGGCFYDTATDEFICEYLCVKNDHDMDGVIKAEHLFLRDYPNYRD